MDSCIKVKTVVNGERKHEVSARLSGVFDKVREEEQVKGRIDLDIWQSTGDGEKQEQPLASNERTTISTTSTTTSEANSTTSVRSTFGTIHGTAPSRIDNIAANSTYKPLSAAIKCVGEEVNKFVTSLVNTESNGEGVGENAQDETAEDEEENEEGQDGGAQEMFRGGTKRERRKRKKGASEDTENIERSTKDETI